MGIEKWCNEREDEECNRYQERSREEGVRQEEKVMDL